jgi:hypothetical protein
MLPPIPPKTITPCAETIADLYTHTQDPVSTVSLVYMRIAIQSLQSIEEVDDCPPATATKCMTSLGFGLANGKNRMKESAISEPIR